MNRKMRN